MAMNLIVWIITGTAALANAWLLYATFWTANLHGAGSAQGDMELFLNVTLLGSAVIVVSLLLLLVGFLANVKTIQFNTLFRRPIVISSLLNISVATILLVYVFTR
jgi:hypothetical protein